MASIFKPMLSWLMDRTTFVCWIFICILGLGYLASTRLGHEFMPPLDEGSILDMPTSVPRMSVTQATDDLKARDAVLRTFPEVVSVVGKAGRAETATDPSPLDMLETIISLRDRELWPKRKLRFEDALGQTTAVLDALERRGILTRAPGADRQPLLNAATMEVVARMDTTLREMALDHLEKFRPELGAALSEELLARFLDRIEHRHLVRQPTVVERRDLVRTLAAIHGERLASEPRLEDVTAFVTDAAARLLAMRVLKERSVAPEGRRTWWESASDALGETFGLEKATLVSRLHETLLRSYDERFKSHLRTINWQLFDAAVPGATWLAIEELLKQARERKLVARAPSDEELRSLREELAKPFSERLFLWRNEKKDLVDEMGTTLQVPGWGNIWTQPIINRIEMLATGVRTPVGVKVFGDDLEKIQRVSQRVAEVLRRVRGANGVVPDQIVGKGYVEIDIDREKAARYGIQVGDIQDVIDVALGGKPLTMTVEGRERFPVRVRYARDFRDDEDALRRLLVSGSGSADEGGTPLQIPLAELATVRVVEGPSMIKSENGMLRAYVQLTVSGRDEVGFVEEARRAVASQVALPEGMYIEWAGQFENELKTRRTLQLVFPAVIGLIVLILYLTYKSWVEASLMLTSVLGALAGGAMFQWLFGFNFSVAVWVGYIACFGMATETGIVMLVYLREAIRERGGLEQIGSTAELKEAILEGAIHRLRPKLLTEGTTILAIAPMLWASGVGSEVIRPMAAPVLGGLLIADEVIDVFLPVLYFAVQKWRWRRMHGLGPFDETRPVSLERAEA
jgi:Cu(I)/Ag(I) efflux system membrane protein CusA/SilA